MAVTYLDAATFQVTYQLKILTTALFAVIMLNKKLSGLQWLSLVILMAGVALIQMPDKISETDHTLGERFLGLIMVLISCFSSGFAGIYFEKVLKGETAGIWVLNVQLATYGVIIALVGVLISDGDAIQRDGFLYGYTNVAYFAISLSAFGGLVVAVVVKYADNILKGFATSISIVMSCLVSVYLFDFVVTTKFALGTLAVCAASYIYGAFPVTTPKKEKEHLPTMISRNSDLEAPLSEAANSSGSGIGGNVENVKIAV